MWFKTFAYKNENNSQPSLFDIKSLFLLEPIYDSGCAIFSNKNYTECGFEKWESTFVREKYTNKGMTWCYYESESKQNGITIINLDFILSSYIVFAIRTCMEMMRESGPILTYSCCRNMDLYLSHK